MKPIKGFDGYFITREGKVMCNLGRGRRDRNIRVIPYEIKPRLARNGYVRVYVRCDETGKRVDRYIHRLVAIHFIDNPLNKKIVNHIDCNRANNNVSNLEWVTTDENLEHALKHGSLGRDRNGAFYNNKK